MIITTESGVKVGGAFIIEAIERNSLTPVPVSFEATIRLHDDFAAELLEGMTLKVGKFQTPVTIKFVMDSESTQYQDGVVKVRKIIALHKNSEGIGHVSAKGIFLENTTLSAIYKASGGKSEIGKDFSVPRFYCYKGDVPSFLIATICQEHGGVVRWIPDGDKLEFTRIGDLFNQEPVLEEDIPNLADFTKKSGFVERHELPAYFSLDASGAIIKGDFSKERKVRFSPLKSVGQLMSMSNVLLNAKEIPSRFAPDINSGQILTSMGTKFVIITAAHCFRQAAGGGVAEESVSVFWLGVKQ